MTLSVTLAVEDVLSEAVGRKLIAMANPQFVVEQVIGNQGFGFLKTKVRALNNAAHNGVVSIIIADLDECGCPDKLRRDWLGLDIHPNLMFRVAVKEVEAWLLADHVGLASYFAIPEGRIPQLSDAIANPKQVVVNLARRSRKSSLRKAMVPLNNSRSAVGSEYNNFMLEFIRSGWSLARARRRSRSLDKAYIALQNFRFAG